MILRRLWPLLLLVAFLATVRLMPAHTQRAAVGLDCSRAKSAIDELERCVALEPDDVELMTELGAAYARRGDAAQAESTYRRALGVDPDSGELHLRLAALLLARGDQAGARAEAAAAAALQPGRVVPDALVAGGNAPQGVAR